MLENTELQINSENRIFIRKWIQKCFHWIDMEQVQRANQATRLLEACREGSVDKLRSLLSGPHPPDIGLCDGEGNTALHHAVRCDQKEVASLLLEHSGDPHRKNAHGDINWFFRDGWVRWGHDGFDFCRKVVLWFNYQRFHASNIGDQATLEIYSEMSATGRGSSEGVMMIIFSNLWINHELFRHSEVRKIILILTLLVFEHFDFSQIFIYSSLTSIFFF
jgi:hypothetical protein